MIQLKKRTYIIIAVLVSPFLGVFLASLIIDILLLTGMDFTSWMDQLPGFFVSAAATAVVGHIISLPWVILYGVPVYFLLRKWRLQTAWLYGLFGYIGGVAAFLLLGLTQGRASDFYTLRGAGMYGLFGAATSLVFWFIAIHLVKNK